MNETEYNEHLHALLAWSKCISLLPLDEMLEMLNRAETIAPFTDPTLYKQYLASPNGPLIKDLLEAGLAFKRVVMEAEKLAEALPIPPLMEGA